MAISNTYKNLYVGQPAAAGTTAITVPANHQYVISSILIANNDSTTDRTIKLFVNGTTDAYCFLPALTIPYQGSFQFKVPITLNAAETLYAVASADSKITMVVNGLDINISA